MKSFLLEDSPYIILPENTDLYVIYWNSVNPICF